MNSHILFNDLHFDKFSPDFMFLNIVLVFAFICISLTFAYTEMMSTYNLHPRISYLKVHTQQVHACVKNETPHCREPRFAQGVCVYAAVKNIDENAPKVKVETVIYRVVRLHHSLKALYLSVSYYYPTLEIEVHENRMILRNIN